MEGISLTKDSQLLINKRLFCFLSLTQVKNAKIFYEFDKDIFASFFKKKFLDFEQNVLVLEIMIFRKIIKCLFFNHLIK